MTTELPPGWDLATADDLSTDAPNALAIGPFGSNLKAQDYQASGVPLVFVREIRRARFGDVDTKYISTAKAAELAAHVVRPGDLLITKMGDPPGDTAVYPMDRPDAVITADCIKLSPDPRVSSSNFLALLLRAPAVRALLVEQTKGVAQQKLSLKRFREIPLPLPPLNEQRRIVARLEALLARSRLAKQALDAIPALLEQFRQSVLAAALRGDLTRDWRTANPDVEPASKLLERIRSERRRRWESAELERMRSRGKVPQDDHWKAKYREPMSIDFDGLPQLPHGWTWATLGNVAPLQAGYAFPSAGFRDSGVRLLKGVNVRDGWIAEDELNYWDPAATETYSAFRLTEGDVVLAMDRPVYSSGTRATKVVRLGASWDGALLLQRVGRFQPLSLLNRGYLYNFLRGDAFRHHLVAEQNGSQDGKDLPHVSAGVVDAAFIPVPPLSEQHEIQRILGERLQSIEIISRAQEAASARLRALEESIRNSAFKGELVSQDPADEPASVLLDRIRADRENSDHADKTSRLKRRRKGQAA